MEETFFAEQIISWYLKHKRNLPWRSTEDPYTIWLSEIILQQTRVAQGLPYYHKFVTEFPTIQHLADAPADTVLRLWQGLGYYSRARNLHACAKIIVSEYGGIFPGSYQELLQLKGIGAYTAAAIASFAYNETVPVVDGNVYRVLSRVFGIKNDILSSKGQKIFRELAASLVPEGKANVYNQAIMEFGALQCTPAKPACLLCPLSTMCYAFQHGQQKRLPVKLKKTKMKHRFFHYVVVRQGDYLLMKQRMGKDIWTGLYDFYLIEGQKDISIEELTEKNDVLLQLIKQKKVSVEVPNTYKHQLTHQRLQVKFIVFNLQEALPDDISEQMQVKLYSFEDVRKLPKPILIDNFLNEQIF